MKNNNSKSFLFTLTALSAVFLCITSLLCSCSSKKSYRSDVSCEYLSEKIAQNCSVDLLYTRYSKDELSFFIDLPIGLSDFSVIYSIDANDLSELGVFFCENTEDAQRVYDEAKKYIDRQKDEQKAFVASYAPLEIPKLEEAEVRKYGNYVIYTMLSPSEKNTAWRTVENELKNN